MLDAVEYSPGGAVTVAVRRAGPRVRLEVSDHGLGIPPAEKQRILGELYRADPDLARSPGGTGLGLYSTRELVSRMRGGIAVQSEPGTGATFTIELPAAQPRRASRRAARR